MKNTHRLSSAIGLSQKLFATAIALSVLAPGVLAEPKKVLVVTATQGFRHSSIPLAERVLAGIGEQTGVFTVVDYVRGGPEGKDSADVIEKMSPEALKKYDGVIFANTTGDLPIPDKDAFIKWINDGHAFIGMHSATDTLHGYRPYIDMIGGEFLTHGAQSLVDCVNMHPGHPSTAHLGMNWFVFDEIYQFKSFNRDQVHGILTMHKHPNNGTPGDYPVAWTKAIGKGRMFYTSLGHREDVWTSDVYQKHILGGIKWAFNLADADTKPQSTAYVVSAAEQKAGFKALFNGKDLTGWKLRHADGKPSWSAQNGMLVNFVDKDHGTDLVSDETFKDFTIRYEYQVAPNSNSGLYLRGRHEIQIFDDFAKNKPEMGGNGGLYNITAGAAFVSRKAGEWQEAEATIKGNKVTVFLNGVKIHDNVEANRATGGELDANLDAPGPILLQGDHGSVGFRNIRIRKL